MSEIDLEKDVVKIEESGLKKNIKNKVKNIITEENKTIEKIKLIK